MMVSLLDKQYKHYDSRSELLLIHSHNMLQRCCSPFHQTAINACQIINPADFFQEVG